mmetsp:Transcript_7704/g.20907  ORF Transcript_7704/g.20907 Transcript_7704/m.20907 type:complete len:92 (+) Transcript_7704:35-310(+)
MRWNSSADPPLSGWHAREHRRKAARTCASSAPSGRPRMRKLADVLVGPSAGPLDSEAEEEWEPAIDLVRLEPVGDPGNASNSSQRRRTTEV